MRPSFFLSLLMAFAPLASLANKPDSMLIPSQLMTMELSHASEFATVNEYLSDSVETAILTTDQAQEILSLMRKHNVPESTKMSKPVVTENKITYGRFHLIVNKDGSLKTSDGTILKVQRGESLSQSAERIFNAIDPQRKKSVFNLLVPNAYADDWDLVLLPTIAVAVALKETAMSILAVGGTACSMASAPINFLVYNLRWTATRVQVRCESGKFTIPNVPSWSSAVNNRASTGGGVITDIASEDRTLTTPMDKVAEATLNVCLSTIGDTLGIHDLRNYNDGATTMIAGSRAVSPDRIKAAFGVRDANGVRCNAQSAARLQSHLRRDARNALTRLTSRGSSPSNSNRPAQNKSTR